MLSLIYFLATFVVIVLEIALKLLLGLVATGFSFDEALFLNQTTYAFFLSLFECPTVIIILALKVTVLIIVQSMTKITFIACFVGGELNCTLSIGYAIHELTYVFVMCVFYHTSSHLAVDPGPSTSATITYLCVGAFPMGLAVAERTEIHALFCEEPTKPIWQVICSLLFVLTIIEKSWFENCQSIRFYKFTIISLGIDSPFSLLSSFFIKLSIKSWIQCLDNFFYLLINLQFHHLKRNSCLTFLSTKQFLIFHDDNKLVHIQSGLISNCIFFNFVDCKIGQLTGLATFLVTVAL